MSGTPGRQNMVDPTGPIISGIASEAASRTFDYSSNVAKKRWGTEVCSYGIEDDTWTCKRQILLRNDYE